MLLRMPEIPRGSRTWLGLGIAIAVTAVAIIVLVLVFGRSQQPAAMSKASSHRHSGRAGASICCRSSIATRRIIRT
jgi:hypothetical protein